MAAGGGEGCIGCGSSGIFGIDDNSTMYVNGQRVSMTLDGARISYSSGMSLLYVGASAVCPNNDCGPRRYQGTWTSPLVAGADGFLGYFVESSQQTNRPRRSRGNKPTLKRSPKRTKAQVDIANALAATGIFDNEGEERTDAPRVSADGTSVQTTYEGGVPNKIAQLADCPNINAPYFYNAPSSVQSLLLNTFGGEELATNVFDHMSDYDRAVFSNSVVAAVSIGVGFGSAKFDGFYSSEKVGPNTSGQILPFGIFVTGATGKLNGRHGKYGSVELKTRKGRTQIDVDLFSGNLFHGVWSEHLAEVRFNERHNRPTHPGDVVRQMKRRDPNIDSGVSCVP